MKPFSKGKKELFEGLAIYEKYDWTQTYPVLHLDLSGFKPSNDGDLRDSLRLVLKRQQDRHKVNIEISIKSIKESFVNLISAVASSSTSGKVVILIDEYDGPILDTIGKPYIIDDILNTLQGFYSAIKTCTSLLRFVFITGVSKFSHVSIFSGLNNLEDISMHPGYATMLGYTQKELEENFSAHIDSAASYTHKSRAKLLKKIKEWYDGYRFSWEAESVYNPYSMANFFKDPSYSFGDYWYSSGTPTSLLSFVKTNDFDLTQDLSEPISASDLGPMDIGSLTLQALLFQTGYLTIKKTSGESTRPDYILDFPNLEVGNSFRIFLLSNYLNTRKKQVDDIIKDMKQALQSHNLASFINHFNTVLASVSYEVPETREGKFQAVFHTTLFLSGFRPRAEVSTSRGRIDHVLELPKATYIIEHKLNRSAEAGLEQIKTKGYADAYLHQGRKIILLGINYSSETSQVTDWKAEVLSASGEFEREILPPQPNCKKNSPKNASKKVSKARG